jgi:two-component system response regulator
MPDSDFLILLAEDEENDTLLLRRMLSRQGLSNPVEHVKSGQRAIDYLSTALGGLAVLPSLVVLDLQTPQRSGLDVLEWIRSRPQLETLPVAILTSSERLEDRKQAEALGCIAYFRKSDSLDGLGELARSLGARSIQAR